MSDEEVQDIKILSESYDKFILLLNTGGIIELSDIINNQNINSVLLISQGGSAFGDAVADILSGKKTPSGKLCATWAKNILLILFRMNSVIKNIFLILITKKGFL